MESLQTQLAAANLNVDDEVVPWLEKLHERGRLSLGWPGKEKLLSTSFVWVPREQQLGSMTSIVSSRLGREIDSLEAIFRVLRSALAQLDPQRQSVLSVEGTTTHDFVVRGCELFGIPLLRVKTPSGRRSLLNWAKATLRTLAELGNDQGSSNSEKLAFVSNPLRPECDVALRDQIEVQASDQLLVLNIRQSGNLHRLVSTRLAAATPARVFLAMGDDELVSKEMSAELMGDGAIGWLLFDKQKRANSWTSVCPMDTAAAQPVADIIDVSCIENQDRYFTHCTRRARGPWPDQQETDYLAELILGAATRDRSSFAALMRIVRMQRLLASGESIRDSTPVVSLTAARLDELSSMRTFRSHRGRWDFEPYGISIDRETLTRLGMQEVIYGDESVWEQLSKADRPFYQKIGDTKNAIDWSVEKEWRVLGDIDLSKVPPDRAFVFVPTQAEAEHLAKVSRWSVIVVG